MNKKTTAFVLLLSCAVDTMRTSQGVSSPMTAQQQFNTYPHPLVQVVVPNSSSSSSQALNSNASQSLNRNHNKLTSIQKTAAEIKNSITNRIKQESVTTMLNTWQQQIKFCAHDAKKRVMGFFTQLGQLLYDHKFKLFAAGVGTIYGYLFFTAQKINRYLLDDSLWSSWKNELTLEQLLAIPQQELAQELLADIQARYVDANEPTNFLSPLARFIQETDAEFAQLQWCTSFSSWMLRLKLSKLLPFNIQKEGVAREKIERLTYLKNIFSSWIAQYKLTSNLSQKFFPEGKPSQHAS